MPDIALCPGTDCPLRERCRRHTATPAERQGWTVPLYDHTTERCPLWWPEEDDA